MQVIVNTAQHSIELMLADTRVCLAPGQRLLLAGVSAPRQAELVTHPLPANGMSRALAHFDHVRDAVRHSAEPPPVCWPVAAALEDADVAAIWLIDQLARVPQCMAVDHAEPTPLAAVLRHLARSESYGLMRFLLKEGGEHSVAVLAERYGLSSAQFHRRCRQVLGRPLKRELRILRAARTLLAYPGRAHSFTYLAADHGYASLSHFCTDIKALIGCSPLSVYRAVKTPAE